MEDLEFTALLTIAYSGTNSDSAAQLETLQAQYAEAFTDRGLEIVLVVYDDDDGNTDDWEVLDWAYDIEKYHGLDFPVLADPGGSKWSQFHSGVPGTMLIDRDHVIRFKEEGSVPDHDRLTQYIEELLEFGG